MNRHHTGFAYTQHIGNYCRSGEIAEREDSETSWRLRCRVFQHRRLPGLGQCQDESTRSRPMHKY